MSTTGRKDYRVTVKVRNNNLLRAIESAGYVPGKALAAAVGTYYSRLNDLINMTLSPIGRGGLVKPFVDRLCGYLGASFDELFSAAQVEALVSNRADREIDAEQLFALINRTDTAQITHDDGLKDAVLNAVGLLTSREQRVIDMRFGLTDEPMTLKEVGDELGVTPERIRQMEAKAFRKLRHPTNSGAMRDFLGLE